MLTRRIMGKLTYLDRIKNRTLNSYKEGDEEDNPQSSNSTPSSEIENDTN